jgi:restriction system protein
MDGYNSQPQPPFEGQWAARLTEAAEARTEAAEALRQTEDDWRRLGFQEVTGEQLAAAERQVSAHWEALQSLSKVPDARAERERLLLLQHLAELRLVRSVGWLPVSVACATLAALVVAAVLIGKDVGLGGVLFALALAYLTTFAAVATPLYGLSQIDFDERRGELEKIIDRWERQRHAAAERLQFHEAHHSRLAAVRTVQERYQTASTRYGEASTRHAEVQRFVASRRCELLRSNWRALRGIPFEEFLGDVFGLLGYAVETTPTTCDYGVDLILTRNGRRIAVQARGYSESVGNCAVRDVYAGMAFYRCDECVAITNSEFSHPARVQAEALNCRLIDGSQIPALIEGTIL